MISPLACLLSPRTANAIAQERFRYKMRGESAVAYENPPPLEPTQTNRSFMTSASFVPYPVRENGRNGGFHAGIATTHLRIRLEGPRFFASWRRWTHLRLEGRTR